MSILGWILLGGVAGWIASLITGESEGCLASVVIGIVGALIGGFIFLKLGKAGITGFNLGSLFVAVVGAVVLLVVAKAFKRRT